MQNEQQAVQALQQIQTQELEQVNVSSAALMLNNANMEQMTNVAALMSTGRTTVPKHLQDSQGDCLAIVMQAMQWGMNPFAVAQKTHLVNGALGYEAQLVNAVVQNSGAITGRFHYEYEGKSPALKCRVGAVIKGEDVITWGEWLCENTVTTKNSPLWKTNPAQQLGYLQVKNWARLYAPGAILGVYSEDELVPVTKDMGRAQLVQETASDELVSQARKAAGEGKASFAKFFNALTKEIRPQLRPYRAELDQIAADVDASRTVDVETKDATTSASSEKVEVTYASVMDKLLKAKNIDALAVAADWIGEVDDPAQRAELTAKYQQLEAEMKG